MKYMLIRCYDNADLRSPEYFDSHEDAFNAMCEYAASVANLPINNVKNAVFPDGAYCSSEAMSIHLNSAWVCDYKKHFKCNIYPMIDTDTQNCIVRVATDLLVDCATGAHAPFIWDAIKDSVIEEVVNEQHRKECDFDEVDVALVIGRVLRDRLCDTTQKS